MTLLYHLGFMGRSARAVGDTIIYLDGQPAPTPAELAATHEAALAEWTKIKALDELPQRRSEMAALFDALPVAQRAALFSVRVAVEQALDRGWCDVARQIVADAAIPSELEPTRAAILALFPPL